MKPVGEPYAGNPHVRFDERGWETERCRMAQATAPILDSTEVSMPRRAGYGCSRRRTGLSADGAFWAVFDPSVSLAVHCGNGLMPVFAPIKVLGRYNAGPRAWVRICSDVSSLACSA